MNKLLCSLYRQKKNIDPPTERSIRLHLHPRIQHVCV